MPRRFIHSIVASRSSSTDRSIPLRCESAWRRNWKSLGFFAVILTFLLIVWARVSVVLFALFANHDYPDMQSMITQIVSLRNIEFILVWLGVGSVFATLAFAISIVSVPMLLDRPTDTMEAIFTSAQALWENFAACLIWALLVVALIIDLVKKGDVSGWEATHFSFRIRTVLWAAILYLITLPLWFFFLFPGWLAWGLISIWFLYRIVLGMVRLNAQRPVTE